MSNKTKKILGSIVAIGISWFFATKVPGNEIAMWYALCSFFFGISGIIILGITISELNNE